MILLVLRVIRVIAASLELGEESRSSIGQWFWLTASQGDLKDSATERYRQKFLTEFALCNWQGWKGEVRAHQRDGDFTAM